MGMLLFILFFLAVIGFFFVAASVFIILGIVFVCKKNYYGRRTKLVPGIVFLAVGGQIILSWGLVILMMLFS